MRAEKKAIVALGFALLSLLSARPVFPAESSLPKEAQDALQKALTWPSYETDFLLDTKEEDGRTFTLHGKLIYRKPGQRRLEIKEGDSKENTQMLVSDGKVEWQYYPQGNIVYRIDNPPEAPGPHRPFTDVQTETVQFVKRVEGEGGTLVRFEAEPRPESVEGAPIPVNKVRLDVSEEDGMLREMVMLDEKGEPVLTQRFAGLKVGVTVPDEKFQFKVPEGASVMQLPPRQQPAQEEPKEGE